MRKAAGILGNGDNAGATALRNHPQEQIKRTQTPQPFSALLTSAAEVAH